MAFRRRRSRSRSRSRRPRRRRMVGRKKRVRAEVIGFRM